MEATVLLTLCLLREDTAAAATQTVEGVRILEDQQQASATVMRAAVGLRFSDPVQTWSPRAAAAALDMVKAVPLHGRELRYTAITIGPTTTAQEEARPLAVPLE